ncbi:MAG TPA: BON domain-containing protein [Rhodanobacteraceae bacterium]|nr:BON domain-containing protein [Rhodanobacteraceae bacterium]
MKADNDLQRDVLAELNWDPSVDARRIDVDVHDGVVTLAGRVSSHAQKCEAQTATLRVRGIRGVVVKLDVELPRADRRSDSALTEIANQVLAWNAQVPARRVQVTVEGGSVTLFGAVEWKYQSRAAEAALRNLAGIVDLLNLIEIKPGVEPRDVTRQIWAALHRNDRRHAKAISVVMNGGTVTLSGRIDSWGERDAARLAAWRAPGIRNVVDQTTVEA